MGGAQSAPEVRHKAGTAAGPVEAPALNIVDTIERGVRRTAKNVRRTSQEQVAGIERAHLVTTIWAEVRPIPPCTNPQLVLAFHRRTAALPGQVFERGRISVP